MIDTTFQDVKKVINHIPDIEELNNSSILITGATGMIGISISAILLYLNRVKYTNITIYLAGRNKEKLINRFLPFIEGKDYFFIQYDATALLDFNQSFDFIIHGASNASPDLYTSKPVETMLANILGVHNLLSYAAEHHTKRLLYISSSEVYGKKEDNQPYLEDDYCYLDILNDRASYPSAKRASETLCVSYANEYSIDTVIVRPGHIYGPSILPGDQRASASFSRNVLRGENIIMKSAGHQLRSYCYSMDCASAILTVLIKGENKQAYNISNKDSIVSIKDIAFAIAKAGNREVIFENPDDVEMKGYNLMSNSSLNSDKLEKLGWKASFSLEEGTQRTITLLERGMI